MRDRPRSVLPPDARRRAKAAVPKAGFAARQILPRAARAADEDERVGRQLEHIHARRAEPYQEQD